MLFSYLCKKGASEDVIATIMHMSWVSDSEGLTYKQMCRQGFLAKPEWFIER
jgi:hypothetical protein